mmetsp:Transcript_12305/g.33683  ORF Transcript_12305/g.33683 Transcript_12305/m.33683 type:complete len:531 (+) Transcript_12305:339-1931(+)
MPRGAAPARAASDGRTAGGQQCDEGEEAGREGQRELLHAAFVQVLGLLPQVRVRAHELCHGRRQRCGLRGQAEVAPARALALAALRGAVPPVRPLAPRAVLLVIAPPRAGLRLLGVEDLLARLAPIPGVLQDVPEARALAVALGALAPVPPLAELAVNGRGTLADRCATLPCFCQRVLALRAPVGGRNRDVTRAGVLTTAAGGAALRPRGPLAQRAVHRRLLLHLARTSSLTWRGIAGRDLLQVSFAKAAVARAIAVDAAGTPHDAVASLRAVAPQAPVAEHAVDVGLARVLVADGRLTGVACDWLPAVVRHARNLPGAEGRAAAAGGGARCPSSPLGPEAVLARWRRAGLRVACADLGLVLNLAHLAPVLRHLRDVAHTGLLPPVALARALLPLFPFTPLAVVPGARGHHGAVGDLRGVQVAANAVGTAVLQHRAVAHALSDAARGGALRPLLPVADLAVLRAAGHGVAARRLYELPWAHLAALRGEDHDLALAAHLAPSASLVAAVPHRPLRDHAIHLLGVLACRRLL